MLNFDFINQSIGSLVLLFLGLSGSLAAQGPVTGFMPNRKSTDIALTYSYERFNAYFFGKEKQSSFNQVRSINLFIEHGISDSFSVVANIPYLSADKFNQGLQDATIFLKYRGSFRKYNSGSLRQITAVGASFPISNYPILTDNPIGQRNTILQGRFLGQYQFNNGLFVHLQAGVDFIISPNNQTAIPIVARTGWGSSTFYFDAWLEYYHSFSSGTDQQILGGQGSRWLKAGGVLYYALNPKMGIFVGGARILSGRNIGQSSRINAGLVYKRMPKNQG